MLSPRSPAGRTRRREQQGCVLKRAGRGRSSPCPRRDTDAAPLPPSLRPSPGLRPSGSIHSPPAGHRLGLAERLRCRAGAAREGPAGQGALSPLSLGGTRQDGGPLGGRCPQYSRVTYPALPYPALPCTTVPIRPRPRRSRPRPSRRMTGCPPAGGGRSASSTGPRTCPSARGVEGRWQHGRGCGGVRRRR